MRPIVAHRMWTQCMNFPIKKNPYLGYFGDLVKRSQNFWKINQWSRILQSDPCF
jgi:hypothetical protein